jgi:hypothetical protein
MEQSGYTASQRLSGSPMSPFNSTISCLSVITSTTSGQKMASTFPMVSALRLSCSVIQMFANIKLAHPYFQIKEDNEPAESQLTRFA